MHKIDQERKQVHAWENDPFSVALCSDIASLDQNGYCRIEGRIKDMIIRGGEKIFPAEVEQFLHAHPKVKDVQVSQVMDSLYHKVAAVQGLQRKYTGLTGILLSSFSVGVKHAGGRCER